MNLNEIAKLLGVSPSTISIVRSGRPGVSHKMRRTVQALLEENGYTYKPYSGAAEGDSAAGADASHRFVQLMKYRKSSLLVDQNEGFVEAIIDAVDQSARMHGYTLLLSTVSHREYPGFLRGLPHPLCSGLLVVATEMEREDILALHALPIPIVILDSDHPALPFSTVTMNNRDLAYTAVSHLFALGHPRVGYLRSSIPTGNFVGRAAGYREALSDLGHPWDERVIYPLRPGIEGALEDMLHILSQSPVLPSAFFADNDIIAIGAMRAMQQKGIDIPGDVSIVGVDNTPLSQICTPPLSTMQISRLALGRLAFATLLGRMDDPGQDIHHIRVGAELIARQSERGNASMGTL